MNFLLLTIIDIGLKVFNFINFAYNLCILEDLCYFLYNEKMKNFIVFDVLVQKLIFGMKWKKFLI